MNKKTYRHKKYIRNREQELFASKKYREKNREKINKEAKERYHRLYANNPEYQKERLEYYHKNKHRFVKQRREYRIKNKVKRREQGYVRMKYLKELMGNRCSACGYNKEPKILQFHHLRDKEFDLSSSKGRKIERDLKEIKKCVLLCPNCHWELHTKIWTKQLAPTK